MLPSSKNEIPSAIAYPGMRNHRIEIPVSTRTIASPRETATPRESPIPMAFEEIAPSVISSTCLFRTYTAGSAFTMKYPMIIAMGTRNSGWADFASTCPR